VDLGCGAGRDARALLLAGWRVLAIDREPAAIEVLASRAAEEGLAGLQTQVAGLAEVVIPACDLVNASLSLPFLPPDDFWPTWQRALAAVAPGGRVSAMLFGDRDAGADDPAMTCPSPEVIRSTLAGFEIEHWLDCEEDSLTALGEPHHFHRVELVARRSTAPAG
jgi:SAM-dependent methyltransferase